MYQPLLFAIPYIINFDCIIIYYIMSSNDKTKKYWQIYYAKNKEKIKARIKKNYDGQRQMTNHKIRYHTDKQYRMKCILYC